MAQIQLRDTFLYIQDGYSAVGAVNLMAGYAIGLTTMTVDGFTTALANGDTFNIAGDVTTYTITAHTETTTHTTSITFTPGLVAMAADNAVITVLPHRLTIKIGEGNLTYSEKRNIVYVRDRGNLSTVRRGDDDPVEVKLDFMWEFLKSSTGQPPTVEDALKKRGNASLWVSSATDPCEEFAVDIVVEHIPPCTQEELEIITLNDFRWEDLAHDVKNATVSVTGKCNITQASVVRQAA